MGGLAVLLLSGVVLAAPSAADTVLLNGQILVFDAGKMGGGDRDGRPTP